MATAARVMAMGTRVLDEQLVMATKRVMVMATRVAGERWQW
jgi:hypothetical protein